MEQMQAAVVNTFGESPTYQAFPVPTVAAEGEMLVDVLAVGLHPRVRSGAAGKHYTNTGRLPLVPGIDGVGRGPDGVLRYFAVDDDAIGSMAEKAVIDLRRSIALPPDVDIAKVAAAMNPAMSSWVALRHRVAMTSGRSVLVLGATGNAGTMAVQVARRLGAGRVICAGRDRTRLHALADLGAHELIPLTDDTAKTAQALASAAAEVDIAIDYLWGQPALQAMVAILTARSDRSRPLDWIQIGAVAGPTLELPSTALRSANLRLQGSGQGAVSGPSYVAELPALVEEITAGTIGVNTRTVPLRQVASWWEQPDVPGVRTVVKPG